MASLIPTTGTSGNSSCLTCTTTRTVNVSFTAPTPAPSGGYIVKWKKTGAADSTYTQVTPNPTASPVAIPNVPACDDITVSVQANCGAGNVSSAATYNITGIGYSLKCGCGLSNSYSGSAQYSYPAIPINFSGVSNGAQITLIYDGIDRPNRFDIYNETDLTITVSSDWVGSQTYPGPWVGNTVTPSAGSISFTYNSAKTYTLKVEAGPADPNNPVSDSWTANLTCAGALDCGLGTCTVAEYQAPAGQNGLVYAASRFVFGNTLNTNTMCAGSTSPAYYLPDPNNLFGGPLSIFQNAAGTQPFNFAYVRDIIGSYWTAPTQTFAYNSTTGAVGTTNLLTCL